MLKGKITKIIGPVIDVIFENTSFIPKIYEALEVYGSSGKKLTMEVHKHIGECRVRCISMDSTDGLNRGQEIIPSGHTISMPNGRLFNVTGESIDGLGNLRNE